MGSAVQHLEPVGGSKRTHTSIYVRLHAGQVEQPMHTQSSVKTLALRFEHAGGAFGDCNGGVERSAAALCTPHTVESCSIVEQGSAPHAATAGSDDASSFDVEATLKRIGEELSCQAITPQSRASPVCHCQGSVGQIC